LDNKREASYSRYLVKRLDLFFPFFLNPISQILDPKFRHVTSDQRPVTNQSIHSKPLTYEIDFLNLYYDYMFLFNCSTIWLKKNNKISIHISRSDPVDIFYHFTFQGLTPLMLLDFNILLEILFDRHGELQSGFFESIK